MSQGLYHRAVYALGSSGVGNTSFQIFPLLPTLQSNATGSIPEWRPWGPGLTGATFTDANEQISTFPNAARQGSIDLQMVVDIGSENDGPTNFTVAVVTLDKDVAAQMTDSNQFGYDLDGMTDIVQTSADRYFCRGKEGGGGSFPSLAGMITFAPDKFRVLKKTQFSLTMTVPQYNSIAEGRTLATSPQASQKRINWKIPCGYTIGPERNDPWSEIRPSPQYVPPHNVRYLVVATDNLSADNEDCYLNIFASTIVKGLV